MAKLSGAVVLLLVVVPLCMYTGALLVGIQVGRALERRPGSAAVRFSLREALHYVAKELWDINVLGRRGRSEPGGGELVTFQGLVIAPLVAKPLVDDDVPKTSRPRASAAPSTQQRYYSPATPSTQHRHSNHTSPRGVISVGPWGGSGGQPFYMHGASPPRLRSIILYHSGAIHSLTCEYTLAGDYEGDGRTPRRMAGPWGLSHSFGSRGVQAKIDLPLGEHITAVEGTTGHFANVPGTVITSLTFRTDAGRTYGPYGSVSAGSHYFSVPAADGACIVGFWGRSGWLLDAIGVYMRSCSYPKYTHRRQGRN